MTRPEGSTPVFVDATGRRRRLVRRIAYAVGAACLTYTGLVGASVIGHPARPGALAPLPGLADRPVPAVRQTQPPPPLTGVPLPASGGPDLEAVPVRVQRRAPEEPPSPPLPARATASRTESTPLPTPTTDPPSPTDAPSPTDPPTPTDPPEPTDPPKEPEPTDPPAPEPTTPPAPEPTREEPPAGLPVVGPILDLLSGGSGQR